MNEEKYKPSEDEIKDAESRLTPEQEKDSFERAKGQLEKALIDEYNEVLDEQDPYEQLVVFHGYSTADEVRETLEKRGVDVSGMVIEVEKKTKTYDSKYDRGGDAYPGVQVKITSSGKVLVDRFFESPDDKYEY
jgi:hypothetical protein